MRRLLVLMHAVWDALRRTRQVGYKLGHPELIPGPQQLVHLHTSIAL